MVKLKKKAKTDKAEIHRVEVDALEMMECQNKFSLKKGNFAAISADASPDYSHHSMPFNVAVIDSEPYDLEEETKVEGCGEQPMPAGTAVVEGQ